MLAAPSKPSAATSVRPLLHDAALPLLATPAEGGVDLARARAALPLVRAQYLSGAGALLFRGFDVAGGQAFLRFVEGFGAQPLDSYDFASTPRRALGEGVFSSTEYPAHQTIPLHNEQAYSRRWPLELWFHCVRPAASGGRTPLADSREVLRAVPAAVRERLVQRGLMYVRNYGGALDLSWRQVFNTDERSRVESYCAGNGITCEWKSNGELRTRQVCQVVAQHPLTREWVWFNQAHLFHVSALPEEAREALLELMPVEDLPRNVYYADGAPIEPGLLDEVRAVLERLQISFAWEAGDVLLIDNMLVAHGRTPFSGEREVLVAMTGSNAASVEREP